MIENGWNLYSKQYDNRHYPKDHQRNCSKQTARTSRIAHDNTALTGKHGRISERLARYTARTINSHNRVMEMLVQWFLQFYILTVFLAAQDSRVAWMFIRILIAVCCMIVATAISLLVVIILVRVIYFYVFSCLCSNLILLSVAGKLYIIWCDLTKRTK